MKDELNTLTTAVRDELESLSDFNEERLEFFWNEKTFEIDIRPEGYAPLTEEELEEIHAKEDARILSYSKSLND
jgi:uncharacterized protein YqfB (UPF0267 family)